MQPAYSQPRFVPLLAIGELLFTAAEIAAKQAVKQARKMKNRRNRPTGADAYKSRKPGADTPLWNICATQIAQELTRYGSKVALARYLGIPRQRMHNFFKHRTRLPDAELTLRLLHWLVEKRNGRDLSL